MEKSLFEKLILSMEEANEMGLIIDESFCCYCERQLPNKKFRTEKGCKWCSNED